MPCDGVAVLSAEVGLDIEKRWREDEGLRDALVADLKAQGFENVYAMDYALYIEGEPVRFRKKRASGQVSANALNAIERYCSELVQAEVLQAIQAEGIQVFNVQMDNSGTLLFDFVAGGL
jgi:hypothetical protein